MNPWIVTFIIMAALHLLAGGLYLFREFAVRLSFRRKERVREHIVAILEGQEDLPGTKRVRNQYLRGYVEIRQSLSFEGHGHRALTEWFVGNGTEISLIRGLSSRSRYRRSQSGFHLGFLGTDRSFKALLFAFEREKSPSVKFILASALSEQGYMAAIPTLIDSLKGSDTVYRERISGLLSRYGAGILDVFPLLRDRQEPEIRTLFLLIARTLPSVVFEDYLLSLLEQEDVTLRREAFAGLAASYPYLITLSRFVRDRDPEIRGMAIDGLAASPGEENFSLLMELAGEPETCEAAVRSLSNMMGQSGSLFMEVYRRYEKEQNQNRRLALVQILSRRLEYFLPRITGEGGGIASEVLEAVAREGHWSGIIGFLNTNRDTAVENALLAVLQRLIHDPRVEVNDLRIYLDPRLLQKLGLNPLEIPNQRLNAKKETIKKWPLVLVLMVVGISFPLVAFTRWLVMPETGFSLALIKMSVNDFLVGFGFYGVILNSLYGLLFFLSFVSSRRQNRYLGIKQSAFLFQKGVLPPLSIVAPAFNEESTIIESVHSLLNLNYPDYEVIVVNDGSHDRTLAVLIETFDLVREDRRIVERLKTQPVRGLYINPALPRLIVVDKVNGGKADSLNAGINVCRNRYFAAIDSDSLLERDALWKVTSSFLDYDEPIIAAGGNILPVNGSRVRLGHLERIGVSRHPVALFQTIEYIRAFMNGRIGWSALNSLMIISGAFGIFHRDRVVEVRGYLTSREAFEKDTVGEDMELVVRLIRTAREQGRKDRALYVPSANCWTEVPESLGILRRQRERWQRGLIDILIYHGKLLLNPRFGLMGLAAFPYYLLFEMIGPWFESLAGLLFLISLALGWIRLPVLFFVILSNILFGVLISQSALLISDWEGSPFRFRDRMILILSAVFENFGFRQLMALFRLTGFVSVLRNVTGWGKMIRKGFNPGGAQ